jgi:hypothetical protein
MPATPHTVTFPGKVRIVDPGPKNDAGKRPAVSTRVVKDPRFQNKHTNRRMKNETVTVVTVPAGYRLDYVQTHSKKRSLAGKPEKPLHEVKVVPDGAPAPAVAAELVHEHTETTKEIRFGYQLASDEEVAAGAPKRQPRMMEATARAVTSVTAKSLTYPGVEGKGSDAASAVADLRAKEAEVSKGGTVERTGPSEPLPTLPTLTLAEAQVRAVIAIADRWAKEHPGQTPTADDKAAWEAEAARLVEAAEPPATPPDDTVTRRG